MCIIITPVAQVAEEPCRKVLAFVGDEACGKTCLCNAFMSKDFTFEYIPTRLGKYVPDVKVNGKNLVLWDIGKKEQYLGYPHKTNATVVCFAVNNPRSLQNVVAKWAPKVRCFHLSIPILLVANKIDCRAESNSGPEHSVMSTEEGKSVAERIGAWGYVECSALTREGVKEVFENASQAASGAEIKISKCGRKLCNS